MNATKTKDHIPQKWSSKRALRLIPKDRLRDLLSRALRWYRIGPTETQLVELSPDQTTLWPSSASALRPQWIFLQDVTDPSLRPRREWLLGLLRACLENDLPTLVQCPPDILLLQPRSHEPDKVPKRMLGAMFPKLRPLDVRFFDRIQQRYVDSTRTRWAARYLLERLCLEWFHKWARPTSRPSRRLLVHVTEIRQHVADHTVRLVCYYTPTAAASVGREEGHPSLLDQLLQECVTSSIPHFQVFTPLEDWPQDTFWQEYPVLGVLSPPPGAAASLETLVQWIQALDHPSTCQACRTCSAPHTLAAEPPSSSNLPNADTQVEPSSDPVDSTPPLVVEANDSLRSMVERALAKYHASPEYPLVDIEEDDRNTLLWNTAYRPRLILLKPLPHSPLGQPTVLRLARASRDLDIPLLGQAPSDLLRSAGCRKMSVGLLFWGWHPSDQPFFEELQLRYFDRDRIALMARYTIEERLCRCLGSGLSPQELPTEERLAMEASEILKHIQDHTAKLVCYHNPPDSSNMEDEQAQKILFESLKHQIPVFEMVSKCENLQKRFLKFPVVAVIQFDGQRYLEELLSWIPVFEVDQARLRAEPNELRVADELWQPPRKRKIVALMEQSPPLDATQELAVPPPDAVEEAFPANSPPLGAVQELARATSPPPPPTRVLTTAPTTKVNAVESRMEDILLQPAKSTMYEWIDRLPWTLNPLLRPLDSVPWAYDPSVVYVGDENHPQPPSLEPWTADGASRQHHDHCHEAPWKPTGNTSDDAFLTANVRNIRDALPCAASSFDEKSKEKVRIEEEMACLAATIELLNNRRQELELNLSQAREKRKNMLDRREEAQDRRDQLYLTLNRQVALKQDVESSLAKSKIQLQRLTEPTSDQMSVDEIRELADLHQKNHQP